MGKEKRKVGRIRTGALCSPYSANRLAIKKVVAQVDWRYIDRSANRSINLPITVNISPDDALCQRRSRIDLLTHRLESSPSICGPPSWQLWPSGENYLMNCRCHKISRSRVLFRVIDYVVIPWKHFKEQMTLLFRGYLGIAQNGQKWPFRDQLRILSEARI